MVGNFLGFVKLWLFRLTAYSQENYLDLINEIEQWGVYDTRLYEVIGYMLIALPVGYCGGKIVWQKYKRDLISWLNSIPKS